MLAGGSMYNTNFETKGVSEWKEWKLVGSIYLQNKKG